MLSGLLGFVVSANLQRRHLTSSQRAVLALAFESEFAVQAKERQGARTDLTSGQSCTNVEHLHAAEPAASVVGVSERLVKDAKRLRREAPERLAGVLSGLYSLHEAIKEGQHQRRRAAVEAATLDPPPVPVTPKDTLATFGCGRHTGNGGYCVALDDLLAHADEAPGTCAEPFEMAARLRSAAFTQQGFPCFACRLHVS